jgi:cell division septum initiation protein DivIVA
VAVIDLLHLIDRLEEQIGEARRLPIGTGSVVDRRRLLDLVDQLRAAVPEEVREARELLGRKEEVLAQADEEVALRLSRADEEVGRRVSGSEVVKAAEARAEQIIAEANSEAERLVEEGKRRAESKAAEGEHLASEQMDEADRYAMEMLRKLEQQLDAFTSSVRSGIDALNRRPAETPEPAEGAPDPEQPPYGPP